MAEHDTLARRDDRNGHRTPGGLNDLAYPFSVGYQKKILAILLRQRQFLPTHSDVIFADHFTTPLYQDTAELILTIWKRHKVVPTFESFERVVDDEIERRGERLPKQVPADWRRLLEELRKLDLSDAALIQDQLITWVKDRAFEEAIMACSQIRDQAHRTGRRDYEKARQIMQVALSIGHDTTTNMLDYFEDADRRIASVIIPDTEYGLRLPTLLPTIDDKIDGGAGRQELIVWAAPTGRGKTHSLMWVTKASLYQGLRVLVATTEMSKNRLALRVDRAIANMSRGDMQRNPELAARRIASAARYRGELKIVELMGKNATVEAIHNTLERLRVDGFEPDVVVCDYPGEMRASHRSNDRRFELAEIYRDLRTLAREWDAACHTAMQTNRASLTKAIVTIKDLAECFEVAPISDLMFALCQTEDEEKRNLIRFFIAKARESEDHFIAPYYFDKRTGNFRRAGDVTLAKDGTINLTEDKDDKDAKDRHSR